MPNSVNQSCKFICFGRLSLVSRDIDENSEMYNLALIGYHIIYLYGP